MTLRNCVKHMTQYAKNKLIRNTPINIQSRFVCTERRSELFTLEKNRQKNDVGRIEKIEVRYLGTPEDVTLVMNKNLSSPYDCAQHLTEHHTKKSALALIDAHSAWDMHRPLKDSCTLQLLHFTVAEPHIVNKAYWRTCSFLLGATIQGAFKDDISVVLHSFPSPNVKSGSFVHDVELELDDWCPTSKELISLSAEMLKLCAQDRPIERLDINCDLALEIFKENPHKCKHIPAIAAQNGGLVTVYRFGNHVDISHGPMISNSSMIGRLTVTSAHKIKNTMDTPGQLYRFQGVSLPKGIIINHFAYGILENRAKQLNPARLPNEPFPTDEIASAVAI